MPIYFSVFLFIIPFCFVWFTWNSTIINITYVSLLSPSLYISTFDSLVLICYGYIALLLFLYCFIPRIFFVSFNIYCLNTIQLKEHILYFNKQLLKILFYYWLIFFALFTVHSPSLLLSYFTLIILVAFVHQYYFYLLYAFSLMLLLSFAFFNIYTLYNINNYILFTYNITIYSVYNLWLFYNVLW